jgi:II/X family phage/plasmid replication protein
MIDWVTAILPCNHDPSKLISGMVMSFDSRGQNEWVVNKQLSVEGSHSSTIQVKSYSPTEIWVSGNPAKFLQGHNIFGTDDLSYLMGRFFDALLKHEELGLCPASIQYEKIMEGDYFATRIDFNLSWHLQDKETVISWIRSAAQCANLKHRGAGQFTGDTLYFGKHSKHWALKCYSKGHEITAKKHTLPLELRHPELIEWANRALRLELVFRSMFLKVTRLNHVKNWTSNTGKELLLSCIREDLQISDNMALSDNVLNTLPVRLRGFYALWLNGEDLRQTLPKNTFYRYKRQFLEHGIDISMIQETKRNNVIPLIRYLEAEPAQIPQWAYDKKLVA